MAKDSEPRAKPITVSELIARSERAGSAFPKSSTDSDRRAVRRAGASGMPSHRPEESADTDRDTGTDTDSPDIGPEANRVTGIIPVVGDDPHDVDGYRRVPGDDLLGVDLPPLEYRWDSTESTDDTSPVVVSGGARSEPSATAHRDRGRVREEPADSVDDSGAKAGPVDPDDADLVASDGADLVARDGTDPGELRDARADQDAALADDDSGSDDARAHEASDDAADDAADNAAGRSPLAEWLLMIGEVVIGVTVGAGLFWGFTELWKRYIYLALILAVVVIFAIVTFSHLLRRRDLPTTLLALSVGMFVTIGPLVLLAA